MLNDFTNGIPSLPFAIASQSGRTDALLTERTFLSFDVTFTPLILNPSFLFPFKLSSLNFRLSNPPLNVPISRELMNGRPSRPFAIEGQSGLTYACESEINSSSPELAFTSLT